MHLVTVRLVLLGVLMGLSASPTAAQLASRPAAEWIKLLDAPARVAGLQIPDLISRLQLKPGDVVADLGAGTGVFSVPLARAVGASGKVYAVEIDQALVDYISNKVREEKAANVHVMLGKFGDPGLPAADVDVAFLHDVLHHVEDRPGYLKQITRYLEPRGRIAIVELDAQKGSHRDNPQLQITKEQLRSWMAALGFVPSTEVDLSPEKWFVVYARQAAK